MSLEAKNLLQVTQDLLDDLDKLEFSPPVAVTYNVLRYAWRGYRAYLEKFGNGPKRVLFLGMNPGPWGMAQTGVPFGEVASVRDWMKIKAIIDRPEFEHPKRPILGFSCEKSEVSGRRLWGLFAEKFDSAQAFFLEHLVINYCPLVFMEESGRNLTPDKLSAKEAIPLHAVCNMYLSKITEIIQPKWVIGVGVYAEKRAKQALGPNYKFGRILHPSPASPAANAGWTERAESQLNMLGIWE
ncbi:MAG: single-stranded DNA-binding protein [Opitutae bacterium]|nr:single-stranded DNA-binding protein [Opitutae bacterium]|tara:strand:+ start:6385 stop:7107 length:723 start_codon:yes stop_codon:yes gene_type:complete